MGSLIVTVICLSGALILVFVGTLLQTQMDIHEVQETIFRPFFIWWKGVPIFPGGGFFAVLLMLNLGVSFWKRKYWKKSSLIIIHAGFALLILGEALRMVTSEESFMILPQGELVNYSESATALELAVIDHTPEEYDQVTSIKLDGEEREVPIIETALKLKVSKEGYQLGNLGMGPIEEGARQMGPYEIVIRPKRTYYPFALELETFVHEIHPGTNIPKFFSSDIKLYNEGGIFDRKAKIWMNNPLHYKGKTFYQASYGDSEVVSVLHIVENRWKQLPYLSLGMIGVGLISHFFSLMRRKR